MAATMTSSQSPRGKSSTPIKVDTKSGSRVALSGLSPPVTPNANVMNQMITHQSNNSINKFSSGETFLEDGTPVDNLHNKGREVKGIRDSHDLSLAETQRQSLVDNMLMSLDQYGTGAYSNYAALYNTLDDETTIPSSLSRGPFRHRGHTLSSSYSSNHARADSVDDASSRYSSHPSRGRRSNSSSNFPPISQRNGAAPSLSTPGRGSKKGSKSSGSSSIDYGYSQVLGTSKWGMHSAHRSASVDNIYDTTRQSPMKKQGASVLERGRPVPADFWHEQEDAAPEPSVPSGPSRSSRNNSPLRLPPHSSYGSSPNRDNKSSLREMYQSSSDEPVPPAIRKQASDYVNARTMVPVSYLEDPIAPAPAVSYRKGSDGVHFGAQKEKPGFFKRVFGSSKTNAPAPSSRYSTVLPQPDNADRGEISRSNTRAKHNHIASQLKPEAQPSSRDSYPSAELQRPSLQKKPSSFFRRRKRSVTDVHPPPSLPLQNYTQPYPQVQPSQPSPSISSLRKVMTPWLNNSHVSPADAVLDQRQAGVGSVGGMGADVFVDGNPRLPETARAANAVEVATSLQDEAFARNAASLKPHSFRPEQKIKTSLMRHEQGDTFLADNSDVEDKARVDVGQMSTHAGSNITGQKRRPQTSPTAPSYPKVQTHDLPPSHVPEELSRKVSLPSPPTSPQSVETAQTHLASTDKVSPVDEDTYVVGTPNRDQHQPESKDSGKSARVWLEPTVSEEKLHRTSSANLSLPFEGARASAKGTSVASEADDELSASAPDIRQNSELPDQDAVRSVSAAAMIAPYADINEPTEEDQERAKQIFDGNEAFIGKLEAAAWLGDVDAVNGRTRKAYMEMFNWTDLNILAAMRDFCQRLVLKGETQQIDRLLHAFSRRWCACNSSHGFKHFDVVHTISYSILLLNTDLHLADIDSKMTRNQFVRNTLPTIKNVVAEAAPDAFDATIRPSPAQSRGAIPWTESPAPTSPSSPSFAPETTEPRSSMDLKERCNTDLKGTMKRLSMRPPMRTDSGGILLMPDSAGPIEPIDVLVKSRFEGSFKGWELQIEAVLKEFYKVIEKQRLPLHGVDPNMSMRLQDETVPQTQRANTLAATWTNNMLRRTPSVLSRAPSESPSYRGRLDSAPAGSSSRSLKARWAAKTGRPVRPNLYPPTAMSNSNYGGNSSSRTSFEESSGVWSPSGASSVWSNANRTATTMSLDSMGSSRFGPSSSGGWGGAYQKSIGFANALSKAIIREETTGVGSALASPNSAASTFSISGMPGGPRSPGFAPPDDMLGGGSVPLLDDERLQLIGAPWAKEGMVKHKHHLESKDRKAKVKNWTECFAVVEKGWMRLFAFNTKATSARQKFLQGKQGPAIVGGGNWSANAEALDAFLLRQTMASALPEPGYSKSRPYVWALSLPTGAVHLFHVGTADIVREFVSTVNYWAARLSKEPLTGGISNVEYGWSEAIIGPVIEGRLPSAGRETRSMSTASARPPSANVILGRNSQGHASARPSMSSIRTSIDQGASHIGMGSMRGARLPGDKVTITEWQPPAASMMASQLLEVDQLRALTTYVKSLEDDLDKHQELRGPMSSAYSPRHPNGTKANANWERKSAYLLNELVKFKCYIESLNSAHRKKEEVIGSAPPLDATDQVPDSVNPSPHPPISPLSPSDKHSLKIAISNEPTDESPLTPADPITAPTTGANTPRTPTAPSTAAEAVAQAAKAALRTQPIEKTRVSSSGSYQSTQTTERLREPGEKITIS
ncbi:MAG: hypothetical protein M1820_003898 [Bogoriella megaspora]|nr:MAG: hypothetical protein M1820_003898 [Bogoriella megaspora]